MALKPVLKLKVDELFLRWMSDLDTQLLLKSSLSQIQRGEPLSYIPQSSSNYGGVRTSKSGQSPRTRPGSPATPPCSPSMASPRSPRKNRGSKRNTKLSINRDSLPQSASNKDSLPARGDPDGQPDTFLRQKEAQLREKRAREREGGDATRDSDDSTNGANHLMNKSPHVTNGPKENVVDSSSVSTNSSKSQSNSQPQLHKLRTSGGNTPSSTNTAATGSSERSPSHNAYPSHLVSSHQNKSAGVTRSPFATGSKSDSHLAALRDQGQRIPQFYFPDGLQAGDGPGVNIEDTLSKMKDVFSKLEGGKATRQTMGEVAKACGMSSYMKTVLFKYFGGEKNGHVTLQQCLAQWRKLCSSCGDTASRFVKLLAKAGNNYLDEDDCNPLVQEVVEGHPGLTFLQDSPEFHSRYVQTVISRIFYCVNRSWTGRLTVNELRRSNLLQMLQLLDEEEDINQITDFFSYEHFYVIYCKFWELDKDHDLFISKEDLARHNDHAISSKMIDRIFSGAVTRNLQNQKLSYRDFVWFLISEEDKRTATSQEYWFRCMDLDGDGVISMYEMEYFYKEQVEKMEQLGIETLPFEDTLCQMLDMIKPRRADQITLRDLKACKLTPIFFDTFFNLDKYLEHEQKDPFANARDTDEAEAEPSDWERYAAEEYELLVAEEGANDNHEELMYEDDFEAEEEEIPANLTDALTQNSNKASDNTGQNRQNKQGRPKAPSPEDDIYDFSTKDLGY